MKARLFVLTLLLAAALPTSAQYADYYYHRVGDTVDWDTHIGYYSWWEWEYFFQNDLQLYTSASTDWSFMLEYWWDSAIQLQYFYTPVPLKIIGIAGSCVRGHMTPEPSAALDTNEAEEYLFIYEAGPGDTFTQLTATRWSPFDPKRYIHFWVHSPIPDVYDSCCTYSPLELYVPISEYYFDSAIWVTDSFYVGGSFFGNISPYYGGPQETLITQYRAVRTLGENRACDLDHQGYDPSSHYCTFPTVRRKRRTCDHSHLPHTSFTENGWRWFDNNTSAVIIYPIIEVDTTVPPVSACDPIANVQVTVAGSSATVTWDDFPNYSRVLLRYGRSYEPQSQWREEDVTGSTLYTLTGLQPVSYYSVTLMAECDTSKKETPWSEPVTFYVGTDTSGGTEGVEGATLLSRLTFLAPNPAQDEVTVTSSFNLTAIDIWTAAGVMVYHGTRAGHDATVDVSWLRAGTYIVAIHTHNGTTHKRLVIAR